MLDYIQYLNSINKCQIISILPQGRYLYVTLVEENGVRRDIYIKDFFPYFFIPLRKLEYHYPYLPINETKQIFTNHPSEIKKQRESYEYTYEADILYDIRFSIDFNCLITQSNKRATNVPLHTWFLDIEVFRNFKEGSPNALNESNIINAIGIHDNVSKKYVIILVLPEDSNSSTGIVSIRDDFTLIKVRNERQLIETFLFLLKRSKPHILCGWNIINFDLSYLVNRIKIYYPDLLDQICVGFDKVQPIFRENENSSNDVLIAGCTVIDFQFLYQKFTQERLESYRLDIVAKHEFGKGKVDVTYTNLDELWSKDNPLFIEYLSRDVELLTLLDEKKQFILFVNELKELSFLPIYYFNFDFTLKFHDCLMIQYLRTRYEQPYVIRTKPNEITEEIVKGAYVKVPQVGLHDWVIDLDASSMYPSGILSYNISPETYLGNIKVEEDKIDLIRKYLLDNDIAIDDITITFEYPTGHKQTMSLSTLKQYLYNKCNSFTITYNGSIFCLDKKDALIPMIQLDLRNKRKIYKEKMKLWKLVKSYVNQTS